MFEIKHEVGVVNSEVRMLSDSIGSGDKALAPPPPIPIDSRLQWTPTLSHIGVLIISGGSGLKRSSANTRIDNRHPLPAVGYII